MLFQAWAQILEKYVDAICGRTGVIDVKTQG